MMPSFLSPRRRLVFLAILGLAALNWPSASEAQVSAEKSEKMLKPAEGLEASLFASEPMVSNPTNMDIDSRGRVWVTEGLNYRLTHRAKARIEDADKIKILEDTDGDGKADKVTVFADKIFPIPMGLAVEEIYGKDGKYKGARVYVGNSPDILVFEDTDGDDKADKKSVLLTGFGGVDSDHGVHGMTLGLDGKLYFTHGDGCCSFEAKDGSHRSRNFDVVDASGRHVSSSNLANTLRANRDGTEFEIIADRQRNNYETANNAFGNGFTSDNDDDGNRGSRVIWVMDGGTYGYHTPGSPRHWGEEIPGNVPKLVGTGNGSPCGIMVYEGSLLPGAYKGCLFEADAGTRQINFFPIERHGSSFRTEYKVLLGSDDNWFRPVDMTAAPDGSIFVADWYDAGVGGHAFSDQNTGRIYRVAPKGSKPSIAKPDFATIPGLIALLKSPVNASQDTARRSLIERGPEAKAALADLYAHGEPIDRARALWVRHAIEGDAVAIAALKDGDPRIREQAVRILGRDLSRNGSVVFTKPEARKPFAAVAHLKDLLPLSNDPDAGVRRELILALRWLPTAHVGEALKNLVKTWDGQDRWYLEALGLALQERESPYLAELFDGSMFGNLDLDKAGQNGQVALPPYFPADRNEAYVSSGTPDLPATALSKSLGLAWRLHRPESLGLLKKIFPALAATELQQAGDDVLLQIGDQEAGVFVAEQALQAVDLSRKFALMTALARKIGGPWRDARNSAPVIKLIESTLADPTTRIPGIALAVASFDGRYGPTLMSFASDAKAPEAVRLAAVEAVGRIRPKGTPEFIDGLIAEAKKTGSTPIAEAAVRTLPDLRDANPTLLAMIGGNDYPLGLRREALRVYARPRNGGGRKVIDLIRERKLPDDLKNEATSIVHNDPDRRVSSAAEELLPLPKTVSGRPLPPIKDLVSLAGDANKGRAVFAKSANGNMATKCTTCHRVQGQGQWIGPDLSTIGTKYGKEELIRSILYPSAAIGYNYKSNVLALTDGRVLTGLVVEEAPDRIVLKTADGKRLTVRPAEVEERKVTEVSLMPEGLAEAMTDRELVDLLAFLTTLKQPVSIVGQYQAIGPITASADTPLTPKSTLPAQSGRKPAWRRVLANAEGLVDLTLLSGDDASKAAYLETPVLAPEDLETKLVLDTTADLKAWLDGKELTLPPSSGDQPRTVPVRLTRGDHELVIRVAGAAKTGLVTTFVAAKPLEFRTAEGTAVSER
jgi:putative membrane-bound dehydrogenase-like protein